MTKPSASKTTSVLMRTEANQLFTELKSNTIASNSVNHFVLHHTARSKVFDNVTSYILKTTKGINAANYLTELVMDNFASVNTIVDLIEDDGAVRTEADCWGCLDLNDPINLDLLGLFSSLINTLNVAKSNPNKTVNKEIANMGVVSFMVNVPNDKDIKVHAIQRTTDVGKMVIDGSKKAFYRKGNEAYIVSDERYKINPDYDFFLISKGKKFYLFVSHFTHFVYTAGYDEVQNKHVELGFADLVSDKLITEEVKDQFGTYINSMGVREKNHFIRAINKGQHKSWKTLKEQQKQANEGLPKNRQWKMKFNAKGELIHDGTKEGVMEFVKFLSHTIVKSASDSNVIYDVSGWTPSSN
ncbi:MULTISPECIES: hypothetical protein [Vibrio]|uniref:Uncharacterized protein n=1 Tax=Vibrio gigantis TaxID=296199 RepID=A0A5M9N925_9VIBR|nr:MULTISPECIES: hypothetical protein [Vibrio]KAA8667540.1 hypothetical protein F4W18_20115 [Vibrio gigantis]TCN79034.1 hypothetical protein EDB62_10274 [Vibrio crassostreae]